MASMADTPDIKATKVITLGCRLNAYESDVIAQNARDVGDTNAVVINTCAVTNDAVAESRRQVRKAKRDNPDARIIVTGCAAQINPAMFANMSEVDQVLGNHEKMNPMSFGPDAPSERIRVNDIMSVTETAPQFMGSENAPSIKSQSRSRAFLQVQNGCDHRCTFCIIPYGRGNSRSVPAGEVVGSVKSLVRQGYNEVVLTGVDLHLSLQAGDDMILKRMKRRHTRAEAIELCNRLRATRPEFTFGADIIAGFPTEDDAMFENSLSIISENACRKNTACERRNNQSPRQSAARSWGRRKNSSSAESYWSRRHCFVRRNRPWKTPRFFHGEGGQSRYGR